MKKQMTIEELEKALGYKVEVVDKQLVALHDVEPGQAFSFCGTEFVALEKTNVGTYVITKNLVSKSIFDPSRNNYNESTIFGKVKDFEKAFAEQCEKANISYDDISLPRQISLLSMDGRRQYGSVGVRAGLLTLRQYQEYVHLLDEYIANDAWYLSTAVSTEENRCHELVCAVNKSNYVDVVNIRTTYGIRPVLVLKDDIVVDVVKKII